MRFFCPGVLRFLVVGWLLISQAQGRPWTEWRSANGALGGQDSLLSLATDGQKIRMVDSETIFAANSDGGSVRPLVRLGGLSSIAYGNGLWVVGGLVGAIYTSPDGDVWTKRLTGSEDNFIRLVRGGNSWIALGTNSSYYISADGINWESRSFGAGDYPRTIAWGAGSWIAGGSGKLYRSADGLNWQTSTDDRPLDELIWTGNRWLGLWGGWAYTSADGVTWTSETLSPLIFADNLVSTGGISIAAGAFGRIYKSQTTGVWEEVTGPVNVWIQQMVWTGRTLVGVCYSGAVISSRDGVSWTTQRMPPAADLAAAAAGPSDTLVATTDGYVYTSKDGIDWRALPRRQNLRFKDMVWSGMDYVAVDGSQIWKSPDGDHWSPVKAPSSSNPGSIIANGQQLVTVGSGGSILRKQGSAGWVAASSPTTHDLIDVEYGGGFYLAIGSSGEVLRSADGLSWETLAPTVPLKAITHTSTYFVGVSGDGRVQQTLDGSSWSVLLDLQGEFLSTVTARGDQLIVGGDRRIYCRGTGGVWKSTIVPGDVGRIVVDRNGFVAGGRNQYILLQSSDGLNWTPRLPFSDGTSVPCAWGNGRFVRTNGQTSGDGLTWTSRPLPLKDRLEDICYSENGFLAVGRAGAICWSPDGLEWESTRIPGVEILSTVKPFKDGYLIAGSGGVIATYHPATGVQTLSTTGLDTPYTEGNLATSSSMAVLKGSSGQIYSSPDGVTWTNRMLLGSNVIWDGSRFIVSGGSKVHTSIDGVTWVWQNDPSYISGQWIGLFDGYYLVMDTYGSPLWVGTPESGWVKVPFTTNTVQTAFDGTRLVIGSQLSGQVTNKPFTEWAANSGIPGTETGFAADKNGDGVPNGIAYLRGMADARANAAGIWKPLCGPGQVAGSSQISFSEPWPRQNDFTESLWYSRDLESGWSKVADYSPQGWASALPGVDISASGDENRRNVTIEVSDSQASPTGFFRIGAGFRGDN